MAQVQIRSRRIEARLDPQRAAQLEPLDQILLADDLEESLFQVRKLFGYGKHSLTL